MALIASINALSTTAEEIISVDNLRWSSSDRPYRVAIKNVDAAITVYIGAANVTSAGANGYEIEAGDQIALDLCDGDGPLYAVAASGTPSIRILEIGQKKTS